MIDVHRPEHFVAMVCQCCHPNSAYKRGSTGFPLLTGATLDPTVSSWGKLNDPASHGYSERDYTHKMSRLPEQSRDPQRQFEACWLSLRQYKKHVKHTASMTMFLLPHHVRANVNHSWTLTQHPYDPEKGMCVTFSMSGGEWLKLTHPLKNRILTVLMIHKIMTTWI